MKGGPLSVISRQPTALCTVALAEASLLVNTFETFELSRVVSAAPSKLFFSTTEATTVTI